MGVSLLTAAFDYFCDKNKINYVFSCFINAQQNSVVQHKSYILEKFANIIVRKLGLPKYL